MGARRASSRGCTRRYCRRRAYQSVLPWAGRERQSQALSLSDVRALLVARQGFRGVSDFVASDPHNFRPLEAAGWDCPSFSPPLCSSGSLTSSEKDTRLSRFLSALRASLSCSSNARIARVNEKRDDCVRCTTGCDGRLRKHAPGPAAPWARLLPHPMEGAG